MEELYALRDALLNWYRLNRRPLPWRQDREPYHVWLSEIMCQQTRVEAVKGYYARFLDALPDIAALAECGEDRLLKLWEGLGYYSRARNLQKAARQIMAERDGVFPQSFDSVRSLPGIGDYTAAAVCSICFRLPAPAVDGNVLRVRARFLADRTDIRLPEVKRLAREQLRPLFDGVDSGELNQALMELGALVCRPNGEPDCSSCPLRAACRSRERQLWRQLPYKSPSSPRRTESRTVFLLRCDGKYAIRKRPGNGLLAGLWEFPNLPGTLDAQDALDASAAWRVRPVSIGQMTEKQHVFTHITWEMRGYEIECAAAVPEFTWAAIPELRAAYSLPTAFRQFKEFELSDSNTESEKGEHL